MQLSTRYIPIFISLISIAEISNRLPFNTFIFNIITIWLLKFILIMNIIIYHKNNFHPINNKDYTYVNIFIIWSIIGIIRGGWKAEDYWEWKQFFICMFNSLLPILCYVFYSPYILKKTLQLWIKICIPVYFLVILWFVPIGVHHFFLGPAIILALFIPIIPIKWKLILSFILIITIFGDLGGRSQVIESLVVALFIVAYLSRHLYSHKLLKILHTACYVIPIVLIYLGVSGIYNIFNDEKTSSTISSGTSLTTEDTRTFIYQEVISSAIKNNYLIWGRTQARGNDTNAFSESFIDIKKAHIERSMNEVCHLNIFTWLGLIGIILYSLIYFRSSYLAIYKSNNIFLKFIGVFIAFRWAYGWIEDINNFDAMSISIWMLISMGLSDYFRKMNNIEFKKWVLSIFKN